MERDEFLKWLERRGFAEVVTVTREANGALDLHTHALESLALILAGDIYLQTEAGERRYQVGDIFHLHTQQPHSERYGESGVTYLVGRK